MIDQRLQMLRMVAHHGTVTAAAEALRYTPSAVSQQLKQLSRELGVVLLEPEGRQVRLTSAARSLLRHADTLFAEWERARAELARHVDEPSGALTMCGFSTAAAALLPPAVAGLRDRFPRVRVETIEAEPSECYELVFAGRADLAVVLLTPTTPSLSDPRFDQRRLFDEPLDLLVHPEHRLAEHATVSLAETAEEAWIVARPGTTYHQLTMASCASAGFTPNVAHYANEWETGTALVAHGFGVALVSRLARWSGQHSVVRIPLRGDPIPARRILAVTRAGAGTSPTLDHALGMIGATAEELIGAMADQRG
ncbi:LysR family transcriptional regulator [Actinobacteria bacterium YIM 96077]|uniref:LysR family transcriptional regulator n=1 Tax=Phytoactinopolyspora halophila TaxID=1981511 RepID=A0A329QVG5_9ACTN|nr:LysR family transcriptional regulator [Phytoactinopolyspora halophila]AYY15553.1 LysR family transcriptional regulator [Actinobacteria bacterium YIM 96077]RAW15649.1 LysR family transcriptional regulator [Phytoactinopolyspora halophila]